MCAYDHVKRLELQSRGVDVLPATVGLLRHVETIDVCMLCISVYVYGWCMRRGIVVEQSLFASPCCCVVMCCYLL